MSNQHSINYLSQIKEATCFSQAILFLDWQEVITSELEALITNNTWEVVSLPQGKKVLPNKWIY